MSAIYVAESGVAISPVGARRFVVVEIFSTIFSNVAVIMTLVLDFRVHVRAFEQLDIPVQFTKVVPGDGIAFNVMVVPAEIVATHVVPQFIFPLFVDTIPVPVPPFTILTIIVLVVEKEKSAPITVAISATVANVVNCISIIFS